MIYLVAKTKPDNEMKVTEPLHMPDMESSVWELWIFPHYAASDQWRPPVWGNQAPRSSSHNQYYVEH